MARALRVLAGLSFLKFCAADGAMELTSDNYDQHVNAGKNAFVKFLAPWCGHCKSMKPAWDKLGSAYEGSTSVVIADVDCTSDGGKSVCESAGVSGYPTIKYFTDETGKDGEDYSGGRDFDSLDKFVKEKLAKKCDPKTKADCDDQEKAYIDKQAEKGAEKWAAEAKRLEGMKGGDMKPDKRAWLQKRINILNGLQGKDGQQEL